MSCFDNYISISGNSRSGLNLVSLPGITTDLLDEIVADGFTSVVDFWDERLYPRAINNLISDVSKELSDRFHVDLKLITRETSSFKQIINDATGEAGVRIKFDLPKYAKIHVIKLEVKAEEGAQSPDATFTFYDKDGQELYFKDANLEVGKNTVFIDRDFETNELLIVYNADEIVLYGTENKYYPNCEVYSDVFCEFPCYSGTGSYEQVNGGGLNVFYNVYCSVSKLVCENINLFRTAFQWKLAVEVMAERRIGCTVNKYTAMQPERSQELFDFYQAQYSKELMNALSYSIPEDKFCFSCKGLVEVKSSIP